MNVIGKVHSCGAPPEDAVTGDVVECACGKRYSVRVYDRNAATRGLALHALGPRPSRRRAAARWDAQRAAIIERYPEGDRTWCRTPYDGLVDDRRGGGAVSADELALLRGVFVEAVSAYSESEFAAGWLAGIEDHIRRMPEFQAMAKVCGGWPRWNDGGGYTWDPVEP